MGAKSFEDLDVWRKAHKIVLDVYALTRRFPKDELFGLTSQTRRSAASAPANIAEGFRRPSKSDKARFYTIALGSLDETRYHLLLAHDLDYGDTVQLRHRVDEVSRMLDAYVNAVIASDRSNRAIRTYGIIGLLGVAAFQAAHLLTSGF
jgi:four helix bundle protein